MDERIAWLRLGSVPGLGPVGQRRLLTAFGSPDAVLTAPEPAVIAVAGAAASGLAASGSCEHVTAAARWLEASEHHLLTLADSDYPAQLLHLHDPPCFFFLHGQRAALGHRGLAIVGSRSASAGGEQSASRFAAAVCQRNFSVVSGLALGIDGAAHRGAIDADGVTIAVMGTGPDRVYPARHRELAHRIVERGALVTEYFPGTAPQASNFPRRNRLISGLSEGVLVVEAAVESGSLITARLAAELGREVFAVPGSIHAPQSRGCHRLIRDGAKLVESAQDIFDELGAGNSTAPATVAATDASGDSVSSICELALAALGHDPCTLDTLCERCGLGGDTVLPVLLELELAGRIASRPGGRYQRLN